MHRVVLMMAVCVLTTPAGARADDPVASCSALSCVSVHAHVETGCGADGRDEASCLGTIAYEIAFDSPLPVESMDYTIDVACSTTCSDAGVVSGTCGWAPPEVRPIGETGCTVNDVRAVRFTASAPPGTCATYEVRATLDASTVLDPTATVHGEYADAVAYCA